MMADTDEVKIGPNATLVLYRDEEGECLEVVLYRMPSDIEGTFVAMNGDLKDYALVKTIIEAAASNLAIEFREERSDA
jgi:hypothetical protein